MDMKSKTSVDLWLTSTDIWLQSLGLLFKACVPLTYDCLRTAEEQKEIIEDVSNHTYYCQSVRNAIDSDTRPLTWDEWDEQHKKYAVEEIANHLEPIDVRDFGNVLTKIFG